MKDPEGLRLPDFIGIGPPRTGTTWLHNVLKEVVVLPRGTKETEFFTSRYYNGIRWYADHFRNPAEGVPIGAFDPNFFAPRAIDRIHTHLPDCRLICTMRDPVDRTYSLYKHLRRNGYAGDNLMDWLPEFKDRNRYATYLRLWRARFGAQQLLVTFFDDLQANPQAYVDRICDFVGARHLVLADGTPDKDLRNSVERAPRNPRLALLAHRFRRKLQEHRAYAITGFLSRVGFWKFCFESGEPFTDLSPELDAQLRERFRPEVEALEELLGRDLSAWKRGPQLAGESPTIAAEM